MSEHDKDHVEVTLENAAAHMTMLRKRAEAAEAEVARLREDAETMEAWIAHVEGERDEAFAHSGAMAARALIAEGNARRYLWLREGDNDEYVLRTWGGTPFPVMDPDETGPAYMLRLEELDAEIDKRMAEEATADAMRGGAE